MTEKNSASTQPALYIPLPTLARDIEISRSALGAAVRRSLQGESWNGALLKVREARGAGGASGKRYEVLLSSLPVELQAKWQRQQPGHELREKVAEHAAAIEEDAGPHRKKGRRAPREPWTQEEREAKHAAFSRRPTSVQEAGKRKAAAVRFFHSLSPLGSPVSEREQIAEKETGVPAPTLRGWVRICRGLDPGDWPVALAPQYRGCQLEAPFSPEARDYIWGEYFRLTTPSLKAVYRRAVRIGKERGWAIPAYGTVKRRIEREPHHFHVLMRDGQEAFEGLFPTQQRDYDTLKLHEIHCCDGRQADVFCRWEDGEVSRPIVITWLELRSRVVLSYVIARIESADAIRLSFKAAAEKFRVIPECVLVDNSRSFASKLLTGGAPNRFRFLVREEDVRGIFILLGITVLWALPYSGRSKPIESFHRIYAEAEKRFDGAYCGNRPDARPENCDPAKAVPIEQYRMLLEETLAEYHSTVHRGDGMAGRTPREVYEALLPQCAPRQPTREQLRLCLLATERVKLTPDNGAVRLMGNRYWCEKLAELPRDISYCVRFNPEDANEAVAVYEGERFICEAPIISRTGFRDQEAAKTHARARGHSRKTLKQQAAARRDMSKARAWITPPGVTDPLQAEVAEALLPTPKVVTPLRPERDYRPEKTKVPDISKEEIDEIAQIILDPHKRHANEGSKR